MDTVPRGYRYRGGNFRVRRLANIPLEKKETAMQKIEFLVWNGKQHVLMQHDWMLEEITVNKAQVVIKLSPKPEPEPEPENKP
jgi:hypothetical protein